MQKWLLILCVLLFQTALAQHGMIFVKKRGIKKVATISEGSTFRFRKTDDSVIHGTLAMVKNDSVFVNGYWHAVADIRRVIIRPKDEKTLGNQLLLTTAGVGMITAGMTLAKWEDFRTSLAVASGMGFGNFLLQVVPRLKRRQYRIGRRFRLQPLDYHFRTAARGQ